MCVVVGDVGMLESLETLETLEIVVGDRDGEVVVVVDDVLLLVVVGAEHGVRCDAVGWDAMATIEEEGTRGAVPSTRACVFVCAWVSSCFGPAVDGMPSIHSVHHTTS
jgi:hypothetical protein